MILMNQQTFLFSAKPNALILLNPDIDHGSKCDGDEKIGNGHENFSPFQNICKVVPPTIVFLGIKDEPVKLEMMRYYQSEMRKVGSRCDTYLYDGESQHFIKKMNVSKKYCLKQIDFYAPLAFNISINLNFDNGNIWKTTN